MQQFPYSMGHSIPNQQKYLPTLRKIGTDVDPIKKLSHTKI